MKIVFNNNNINQEIESNGVNYIFGANNSGKTYILNVLRQGFLGQEKSFLVDGAQIEKNTINVIYYDDTTDFSNEFKFTKNNQFRKLIYENILKDLNEEAILEKVNKIFDKVDDRVNKYLDINLNKQSESNIRFDIEIEDINDIVDKFTNIYIDNYILNKDNLPRNIKRKLIYELLLLQLDDEKTNIVLIDNFDLYLDYTNTVKIIKKIEEYSKKHKNTHFFLTTSNNIYELIENKNNIFHISHNIIKKIKNLKAVIEKSILEEYFYKENPSMSFDEYKINNMIIFQNDTNKLIDKVLHNEQYNIGKIYINDDIDVRKIINIDDNTLYYLYKNINEELNKGIDNDTLL